MAKYVVAYREIVHCWVVIDAEDEEEALEKYRDITDRWPIDKNLAKTINKEVDDVELMSIEIMQP